MTSLTKEATVPLGVKPRDADRSKNFFALGLICWVYSRPVDQVLAWIDERFAQQRPGPHRQPGGVPGRAGTSARPPRSSTTSTRSSGPASRPASTPRSPATPRWPGASSRRASRPTSRSSSAATRSRRPRTSSTSWPKHKNFGVRTLQAEDEIAAVGTALGAAFAGHLGVTTTSGPGLALKSETHQPGRQPRAAAARHRHPARRAVDRAAHQDRGGRPQHGALRAPRRGAAAGRGRVPAVALLRRRHRGRPHRPQVPDAGDPAVGRLHRQRRRAVAAARRRRRCPTSRCPSPRSSTTSATTARRSSGRTCAIPRRWPGRGPSPARPGLMHRIGGIEKEDGTGNISYDAGEPRAHGPPAGGQGGRHRQATSRPPWCGATRTPSCWWSAGARPGPPSTPSVERLARRGTKVAWVHLVHLNPLPPNLGDIVRRYRHVVVPEMNLGQLCRLLRAEYLVDAKSISKVQGVPFTALRARAGLRRRAGRRTAGRQRERHHRPDHQQEGLDERPGGPLVPGLRRLRDPHRRPDAHAGARRARPSTSCSSRASAAPAASRTT